MSAEVQDVFIKLIGTRDCNVQGCDVDSIRGEDFTAAVKYFYSTSVMHPAFNSTTIVLVPKSLNPSSTKDFRPVSYCSMVYKTVTRILVDRLDPFFPSMVSLNQTAFVKGRCIVDNTLLAQEIVKGYARKTLSPMIALKIDLQKAFDSLNWEFLSAILEAMGLTAVTGEI
ncbi:uncharacterized protein LOC120202779 [Hibiscus syriacus]|uniref:uncharacterized protein LOC120202779 n=1 Tax=Hibiscus syriacus TaxID=106335 RepID=UPI0019227CA3|nr:uncharacterized protein LOC120202779 [Hibiscus syriacus]